jgi:hypothetical protein
MANPRHRGSQGVPIVLLSAVAVFAVALTWRLTIGNQPQREGQELLFMFLALASGGTASVSGLQFLLLRRPAIQGEPRDSTEMDPDDEESPDDAVLRGVAPVPIHHVELDPERLKHRITSGGSGSRISTLSLPVDGARSRAASGHSEGDLRGMGATELGNLVADHYRQRGDVVEFLPDPAAGTVELMVLVKGRRRVVLCVAGGREVTPAVVRELVGTQRIEHADDATLVSTGIGTESALNLATEQAVEWIGPDEMESWKGS